MTNWRHVWSCVSSTLPLPTPRNAVSMVTSWANSSENEAASGSAFSTRLTVGNLSWRVHETDLNTWYQPADRTLRDSNQTRMTGNNGRALCSGGLWDRKSARWLNWVKYSWYCCLCLQKINSAPYIIRRWVENNFSLVRLNTLKTVRWNSQRIWLKCLYKSSFR